MRGTLVAMAAASAVLLCGCAGESPPEPTGTVPTGTVPTATLPTATYPTPPTSTPTTPTSTPTAEGAVLTVRGTVAPGVEANCLVLVAEEREYLLLDAGPEVRPGAEIVVRGRLQPGLPTTCMQATPLVVLEAEPVQGGAS